MLYEILKIEEAFRGGQASKLIQKFGNVLGRKIGSIVNFTTIPMTYTNEYGDYAGYLGKILSLNLYIKINFLLTKSDTIVSIDVYLSKNDVKNKKPSYTIPVYGLNIIEILKVLVEALIDDNILEQNTLEERRPPVGKIENFLPIIQKWVDEDPKIIDKLQKDKIPNVYSKYFIGGWAKDKPNYKAIKYYMFVKIIKRFLLENGMTNANFRKRKKGSKENAVEDPILQDQMSDIVENINWQKKFDILELFLTDMVKGGNTISIYTYGQKGVGKTYFVENVLKKTKAKYVKLSGGIKNTSALMEFLYEKKDGYVIWFDDLDAAVKGEERENIFKALLDSRKIREVSWLSKDKEIPSKFTVSSRVIFTSNKSEINMAIADRSRNIAIYLTVEELVAKIKDSLNKFRPEVSMKIKEQALEFAKELGRGIAGGISYRILDSIIASIELDPREWKQTALLLVTSI